VFLAIRYNQYFCCIHGCKNPHLGISITRKQREGQEHEDENQNQEGENDQDPDRPPELRTADHRTAGQHQHRALRHGGSHDHHDHEPCPCQPETGLLHVVRTRAADGRRHRPEHQGLYQWNRGQPHRPDQRRLGAVLLRHHHHRRAVHQGSQDHPRGHHPELFLAGQQLPWRQRRRNRGHRRECRAEHPLASPHRPATWIIPRSTPLHFFTSGFGKPAYHFTFTVN